LLSAENQSFAFKVLILQPIFAAPWTLLPGVAAAIFPSFAMSLDWVALGRQEPTAISDDVCHIK
jgi:hypothetical protein